MALDAIVVIPARDEEARIAACLQALAAQTISSFETIVVLDACADATESVTARTAKRLGLTVHLVSGPGAGSGPAAQARHGPRRRPPPRRRLARRAHRLHGCRHLPDAELARAPTRPRPGRRSSHRRPSQLDPAERRQLPSGALRRRGATPPSGWRACGESTPGPNTTTSPARRSPSRPPFTDQSAAWSR